MRISSFRLKNYRRLVDIELNIGDQKTRLVGANISGKTSCVGALHTFLMKPESPRLRDVSEQNWKSIVSIGTKPEAEEISPEVEKKLNAELASSYLPWISLCMLSRLRPIGPEIYFRISTGVADSWGPGQFSSGFGRSRNCRVAGRKTRR